MTSTNSPRIARKSTMAKKTQGSFRVKSNPNNNVVVNVTKRKIEKMEEFDYAKFFSSEELTRMNDCDIVIRNILTFGEDVVFAENIRIWEVQDIIAICDEIHGTEVNVTFTKLNEDSAYVRFGAKLDLS